MTELASRLQLRMSWLRWALFLVPLTVLLGFMSSAMVETGSDNRWFAALQKPSIQPPDWLFGPVWAVLFVLIGLAVTFVASARGAKLRGPAIALYTLHFLLLLAWSPYFFGMRQVTNAFYLLLVTFVLGVASTLLFGRIRRLAAWLMVPYLAWLCFAAILNKQIDELNPNAETLQVPRSPSSVIIPFDTPAEPAQGE